MSNSSVNTRLPAPGAARDANKSLRGGRPSAMRRTWAKQSQKALRSAAILGLCFLMVTPVGCSTTPQPLPAAPQVTDYIVGAPDILTIHILPDPVIEREVRVRSDGMISIDLIGDVLAAGRTPAQIAQEIRAQISRFKRDAVVNVTVVDSPSQFVTVYGEVGQPGTFPLSTETRVSEAIGQVGGTRPFASLNNVRVIRATGGETQVLQIRLGDIQKGDLSTNIVVAEGDLIVVPPSMIARFGYTMQLLFFPFSPILNAAGQAGGAYSGISALR